MPPQKSTRAEYYSMRLNPATSDEDAKTLEIIKRLVARGFTFKSIAQDAILRADGNTPEMFSDSSAVNAALLGRIEDMLTHFAEDLIKRIGSNPYVGNGDDEDSEEYEPTESTDFARTFARGFLQRQNKGDK